MAAKKKSKKAATSKSSATKSSVVQLAIDLKHAGLTTKDVSGMRNSITKAVVQAVMQGGGTAPKNKEPFVKIIFGKLVHAKKVAPGPF